MCRTEPRKAGLLAADSIRALMSSGNSRGSLTQTGTSPHRNSAGALPFGVTRTARIGWVGAIL